ncbi:MAG TPA: type II toxin-antitoxin system VapC family toxin [Candidatus Obscuribacterales bacterium]
MAFVLDNSISASWILEDEFDEFSSSVLDRLFIEPAIVPGIWVLEITNTLLVGFRRKRIALSKQLAVIDLLKNLPITVEHGHDQSDIDRIFQLGETYNLSAYDAAYLDLAIRLALPLATKDSDLVRAAELASVALLHSS